MKRTPISTVYIIGTSFSILKSLYGYVYLVVQTIFGLYYYNIILLHYFQIDLLVCHANYLPSLEINYRVNRCLLNRKCLYNIYFKHHPLANLLKIIYN